MQRIIFLATLFILPLMLYGKKQEQHPITTLKKWYREEKKQCEKTFKQVATIATASDEAHPSIALVELTDIGVKKGLIFFTHSSTTLAHHLKDEKNAALHIYLHHINKTVTVEGIASLMTSEETEKTWNRLPQFKQHLFVLSDHETPLPSMDLLKERKKAFKATVKGKIPRPLTFIGYQLIPDKITFCEMQPRDFCIKNIFTLKEERWTAH